MLIVNCFSVHFAHVDGTCSGTCTCSGFPAIQSYENSFSFSLYILCKLFLYPSTGSFRKTADCAGRTQRTPSDCQFFFTVSGFFCHFQIGVLFFPQFSIPVPFLELYD